MKTNRRVILMSAVALIAVAAAWPLYSPKTSAYQQDRPAAQAPDAEREGFMKRKLYMVQQIVEGINTEDFDLVEKGGIELLALAESASWQSTKDPYYRHYSANFEHATKGLIEAAESKSVEKTTFAYVHVTISCTACHQHVRGTVRVAR
jgi:hypothetical protein